LWELLLGDVERCADQGLQVEFWDIPRGQNVIADRAAKAAALKDPEPEFADTLIIGI
jgi:ribonuclease HI